MKTHFEQPIDSIEDLYKRGYSKVLQGVSHIDVTTLLSKQEGKPSNDMWLKRCTGHCFNPKNEVSRTLYSNMAPLNVS